MSLKQPPLITANHISFSYGAEQVLDNVSVQILPGDFVGLIGPNGSGKTTLLKILLGLLKPNEGHVELFGQPQDKFKEKWRLGYVPQKVGLSDTQFPVTVRELVTQGRTARVGFWHRLTATDYAAINQALADVDMSSFSDSIVHELSGGQQQRVYIARALAAKPDLLILDEPTVGVDIESQEEFYELLAHLKKSQGLTIIMVSHEIDVVMNEVNQLLCLNKRLIYHGTPKEFLAGDYLTKLYGQKRHLILHNH